MHDAEFKVIDGGIHEVAQHACHALLALDELRFSPDPAMRRAYRHVHDLIGDLGALRIRVSCLPDDRAAAEREPAGDAPARAGGRRDPIGSGA